MEVSGLEAGIVLQDLIEQGDCRAWLTAETPCRREVHLDFTPLGIEQAAAVLVEHSVEQESCRSGLVLELVGQDRPLDDGVGVVGVQRNRRIAVSDRGIQLAKAGVDVAHPGVGRWGGRFDRKLPLEFPEGAAKIPC